MVMVCPVMIPVLLVFTPAQVMLDVASVSVAPAAADSVPLRVAAADSVMVAVAVALMLASVMFAVGVFSVPDAPMLIVLLVVVIEPLVHVSVPVL